MFRIAIVEDQDETRECLNRFVRQYADFVLLAGMLYLCTDINKKGAMYCAVWSLLIAQCAYESWCFLELQFSRYGHPLNMASPWAVLVQLLSGAVFFAAVYILLARQLPYKGEYHIGPRQLLSSFFIGILFMVQAAVLDNFRAEQFPRSVIATILIGQFYFITLLYFQSELFKKSAMEKRDECPEPAVRAPASAVSGCPAECADDQQALPRAEGADRRSPQAVA